MFPRGRQVAHREEAVESATHLVLPNADGKPFEATNLLRRVLHPALTKGGLQKTGWRVFRRSVATTLSEMREPVRTAQQVLREVRFRSSKK